MVLTDEQLEQVKTELEKGEKLIPEIVKKLFPDEKFPSDVRQQLIKKYSKKVIRSLLEIVHKNNQPPEPTTKEKIDRIEQQLINIARRKTKLEEELTQLQS